MNYCCFGLIAKQISYRTGVDYSSLSLLLLSHSLALSLSLSLSLTLSPSQFFLWWHGLRKPRAECCVLPCKSMDLVVQERPNNGL